VKSEFFQEFKVLTSLVSTTYKKLQTIFICLCNIATVETWMSWET